MNYPKDFESKIAFDQVKQRISDLCISSMGKKFVHKLKFSSNIGVLKKLLDQSSEMVELITTGPVFPAKDFIDLRDELSQLVTPGSYINKEVLFDLKLSLNTISDILNYFEQSPSSSYVELKNLAYQVNFPNKLLPAAEKIIDEKGEIRNSASTDLESIRKSIESKKRQVLRETKKAFENAKKLGYVPENGEVTIRNGRSVIPLKSSNKRSIGGLIHDESSTGQTVFVEAPISFEINNEIKELENEEHREIIRILANFTNNLRPNIPDLFDAYRFLALIDFIWAKAKFALKIGATQPILTSKMSIDIKDAKHPLLLLTFAEANKTVVPLDYQLNQNNRILIISGPNAGGKSVCLKTIGLLQYMVQCGLLVSASPDSIFRVFENLFIDIGDDQSLENDLSTYSSHLLNMKFFLKNSNKNTLVLIDEFGTGTEPQLGGSIAEATLEELNKNETYGIITTHYTNIKIAAEKLPGMINGAMLFDSKNMQPLYKLQTGKPGSSFAFEIAKKIGFPSAVLNNARKKTGGKHVRFDKQLQQLEVDKLNLQKQKQKAESYDANLTNMISKYNQLISDIEKSKKQIIKDAKAQALNIIESSNKAIEKTIKEIKEAGADKEKTKEIRSKLSDTKEEIKKEKETIVAPRKKTKTKKQQDFVKPKMAQRKIEPGAWVKIAGSNISGELLTLDGSNAEINANDIRITTTLSKLEITDAPKQKTIRRKGYNDIVSDINQKAASFNLSIDLRGKRAEEALSDLQRYIDEAILLNISEVNILHGKGYGILREIIREYLGSVSEIRKFGDAPIDMGGSGITRVYF